MASAVASRWLAVGGAILIAAIAADSLVPFAWQVRTGLHWLTEHFLAYFAVTIVFCIALQRALAVAGVAMIFAALMELLQGLTADRVPDLLTALSGAPGALYGNVAHRVPEGPKGRVSERWAGSATSTNVMYR
jgi:VanZ family protein